MKMHQMRLNISLGALINTLSPNTCHVCMQGLEVPMHCWMIMKRLKPI